MFCSRSSETRDFKAKLPLGLPTCEYEIYMHIYLEIKGQLDATDWFFIADLIACSTCFGHRYAHHKELKIYTDVCCLWYLVFWFTGRWSGVELWGMCSVCGMLLELQINHLYKL